MNQRFLIFMMVAMALLILNNTFFAPRNQQGNQDDAANKEKDEKEKPPADEDKDGKKPDDGNPDDKDKPDPKDPPKKPAIVEAPRPAKKTTIGSLERDAEDRPIYPFLVTLTTKGGAIERVELSNTRFRDIEDRSGYLGHLDPSDFDRKARSRVHCSRRRTRHTCPGCRP